MASLKVPFQGNSIRELYKKMSRGLTAKIPARYSKELYDVIKLCLTRNQNKRPTAEELLKHPILIKKNKSCKFMKPGKGFNCVPFNIMGTIRLPDNLDLLIQQLPQQRYSESQISQVSQVSIKKNEKKTKDQDQDHENINANPVNIIQKTEPIE